MIIATIPFAVVTIGKDTPDVVVSTSVIGAEPPVGGDTVIISDALVISGAVCARTEIG